MDAVSTRERGNALYRRGQLTEAIKAYQEATHYAAPDDYLPWSNLSAAHYEAGNLDESIECAQRALALCQVRNGAKYPDNCTGSAAELKLLLRGVRALLHTHQLDHARQWLHRLQGVQNSSSLGDDLRLYRDVLEHSETIWRLFPNENEYKLRLVAGLPCNQPRLSLPSDSSTSSTSATTNVCLDQLADLVDFAAHSSMDRNLSVFLAGLGDGRHFFAQLAILGVSERMVVPSHSPLKRQYRFTLGDSSPTTLARNLVLLAMLDKLACQTDISQAERTEIYTTVYYTFAGMIIPRYAADHLIQTVTWLVDRLQHYGSVLPGLCVYESDRPRLVRILETWLDKCSYDRSATRHAMETTVKSLSSVSHVGHADGPPKAPSGCQKEFDTYLKLPILQAPRSVMNDHEPQLLNLLESDAPVESLEAYITTQWCINPTLSDETRQTNISNPFNVCRTLYNIVSIQERGGPRKTKLFEYASCFFQMVVVALRKIRQRLLVEYIIGDAIAAIDNIQCALIAGRRSALMPVDYDLVYLNESGGLSMIVRASKILNESQAARLIVSYRVVDFLSGGRPGSAAIIDESVAIYKLTQMKITGRRSNSASCRSHLNECALELRRERLAPFAYEQLLSRADLTRFLFSQFHTLALPPLRTTVRPPSANVTHFFHLLIHLYSIGYPAHWLADVLAKILGNGTNTSPSPPRTPDETSSRSYPANTTLNHAIGIDGNLAPFIAEASVLTSMFQRVLPFATIADLPPLKTIYQYSLDFEVAQCSSPLAIPTALVFYNSRTLIPTSSRISFPEEGCTIVSAFTIPPIHNNHETLRVTFWMREDVISHMQDCAVSPPSFLGSTPTTEPWLCNILCASDHKDESVSNDDDDDDDNDEDWKFYAKQPVSVRDIVKGEQWVSGLSPAAAAVSVQQGSDDDHEMMEIHT